MKLSQKQRRFAYYYVITDGNAYRSALRAGYARSTAKNAVSEILNHNGVRTYLNHRYNATVKRASRRNITIKNVINNLLTIGSGQTVKRRFKKIDHNNPNKSTDITIIGSAPIDQQVKAGETLLRFNHKLETAKVDNLKAQTELTKSKLPDYQNHKQRKPLFLDSIIKYHRDHEQKLRSSQAK